MIPWLATASAAGPDPYVTAVSLIEDLYLRPEEVQPRPLFLAAAHNLEDEVPWLLVSEEPAGLALHRGALPPFATIPWPTLESLPGALRDLATHAQVSGWPLDGVDVELAVLGGMTEALDPHSRVLADERLDRFTVRLSGTFVGVGATFSLQGDDVVVTAVQAAGPAAAAGLRKGDVLLRIDGRSTRGLPVSEVSRRVRGEVATSVVLRVSRDGVELDVVPVRAEVVVPNVTSRVLEGDVGYVAIDHVSQKTVENLLAETRALAAAGAMDRGLVIDLRGNTGGSMKESARLADLFVDAGELLRTLGKGDRPVENLQHRMIAADDGTEPPIPIAVLVDERTASGAEILAGALLELDRAVLVGRRTYGKGTVQKVYDLTPSMRLKLTVARYVLAHGRNVIEGGLVPDATVGRLYDYGSHLETLLPAEVDLGVQPGDVVWQLSASPDLVLELGRRAVLGAEAPTRAATRRALDAAVATVRGEQEAALAQVVERQGVDWSAPPAPESAPLAVDVTLEAERVDADTWQLAVDVTETGGRERHQVSIELEADHARWWDGVRAPIGHLPAGGHARRVFTVDVDDDVWPRADEVAVTARAAGSPPLALPPRWLPSAGPDGPTLRAVARLLPPVDGARGPGGHPVRPLEVTVQNLGREAWSGVEVHLGYADVGDAGAEGVELVDWGARAGAVDARSERVVQLVLEVPPGVETVPLELTVEAEGDGELASWPVVVGAAAVALQAPRFEVPTEAAHPPAGRWTLPVRVRDDGALRHVVVWLDGHKVAWAPGQGPELAVDTPVTLSPGAHRISMSATDDQGLVTRRTWWVRAEPPAAVDADGP